MTGRKQMILAINTGSSSIKYKIFIGDHKEVLAGKFKNLESAADFRRVILKLSSDLQNFAYDNEKITTIVHRVVHGKDLSSPYTVNEKKSFNELLKLNHLAPLHNPNANLAISLMKQRFPKIRQLAIFDTSFFRDLPEVSRILPIDQNIAKKHQLFRYGFHGISHQYVLAEVDPENAQKVISIHLGAGCSITASVNGKPIETSMSFTPLDGLVMRTRSGAIDPGLVLFLVKEYGVKKAENILQNESGLKGLSGINGGFMTMLYVAGYPVEDKNYKPKFVDSTELEKEAAKFAIEKFIYEIRKYLGAYNLIIGGADKIVFTGEIGFGSSWIRSKIMEGLDLKIEAVKPDEELAMAKLVTLEGYL